MATLGAELVPVSDHLGVAELQARWRQSGDATLARHCQVARLLAEGRSCAEVARLTGFGLARLAEPGGWEALRAIGWTIPRPAQAAFKKA